MNAQHQGRKPGAKYQRDRQLKPGLVAVILIGDVRREWWFAAMITSNMGDNLLFARVKAGDICGSEDIETVFVVREC